MPFSSQNLETKRACIPRYHSNRRAKARPLSLLTGVTRRYSRKTQRRVQRLVVYAFHQPALLSDDASPTTPCHRLSVGILTATILPTGACPCQGKL